MSTQMSLVLGPITYTLPQSSTRFYFTPSVAFLNGQVDIVIAYSDPDTGNTNLQPQTYIGYTVDAAGNVSTQNGFTSWISGAQSIPKTTLNYQIRGFNGPASSTYFGEYYNHDNGDGTSTFHVATVNTSGGTPVVNQVGSITVTPIPKTLTDNITAELGDPTNGTSLNNQIFEVAGAPGAGQTSGTFMIYNNSGTVLVAPKTGFSYSDGKAHTFGLGGWNQSNFGELVEVWNPVTGRADLQLSLINATTGAVTTGWTAATELTAITSVNWQFITPGGSGMLVLAGGNDAAGRGFFLYVVNDSTSSGGLGGSISNSLTVHYNGAVTQDARLKPAGISNEYLLYWVDAGGLTIKLLDSSLNTLQTYNFANANGTANLTSMANGEVFVTYRSQTAFGSSPSAVDE